MSTLAKLERDLGRVEGKLDLIIERMDARDARHDRLEGRLRRVEHRQHWYAGVGTTLGTLAGLLCGALLRLKF